MQRSGRVLFFIAAMCLAAGIASAEVVAGRDYELIKPPQPTESGNKVEVIEFFSYACPHCNALQPSLRSWLKRKPADVEFRRLPVVFQESWVPFARIYYTVEAMGLTDKLHHEVFTAIHEQKIRLQEPEVLFGWVTSQGIDRKKFTDTYNSFAVQSRAQRAADVTRRYDIPYTPVIVVDGRYLTAPSMTSKGASSVDYDGYFKALNQVIALARKNHTTK
jgi:thiol:disulfide interchange protein DsbA